MNEVCVSRLLDECSTSLVQYECFCTEQHWECHGPYVLFYGFGIMAQNSVTSSEMKMKNNQSVEKASVAFVKGISERNTFFKRINKQ